METIVKVDNLKCGGCATTIRNHLFEIHGVETVIVLPETDEVRITYADTDSLKEAKDELRRLGYPESGTTEGIGKITSNLRSYVSCAIGKINNPKTD